MYKFDKQMSPELKKFFDEAKKLRKVRLSNQNNVLEKNLDMSILGIEVFRAHLLDSQNRLIETIEIKGDVDKCSVPIRSIMKPAILCDAASFIMVHNHPGGTVSFSETDKRLTAKIKAAGEVMDIELLDHVLIHDQGCTSMRGLPMWDSL